MMRRGARLLGAASALAFALALPARADHLGGDYEYLDYIANRPSDDYQNNIPSDDYYNNIPSDTYYNNYPSDTYYNNYPSDDYYNNYPGESGGQPAAAACEHDLPHGLKESVLYRAADGTKMFAVSTHERQRGLRAYGALTIGEPGESATVEDVRALMDKAEEELEELEDALGQRLGGFADKSLWDVHLPPRGTCAGACGRYVVSGHCSCAVECVAYDDCCDDYSSHCGPYKGASGERTPLNEAWRRADRSAQLAAQGFDPTEYSCFHRGCNDNNSTVCSCDEASCDEGTCCPDVGEWCAQEAEEGGKNNGHPGP